jgi:hypothetical protein
MATPIVQKLLCSHPNHTRVAYSRPFSSAEVGHTASPSSLRWLHIRLFLKKGNKKLKRKINVISQNKNVQCFFFP